MRAEAVRRGVFLMAVRVDRSDAKRGRAVRFSKRMDHELTQK